MLHAMTSSGRQRMTADDAPLSQMDICLARLAFIVDRVKKRKKPLFLCLLLHL